MWQPNSPKVNKTILVKKIAKNSFHLKRISFFINLKNGSKLISRMFLAKFDYKMFEVFTETKLTAGEDIVLDLTSIFGQNINARVIQVNIDENQTSKVININNSYKYKAFLHILFESEQEVQLFSKKYQHILETEQNNL